LIAKATVKSPRPSKLDPFQPAIRELLDQWPRASSVVIGQRIWSFGYTGGRQTYRQSLFDLLVFKEGIIGIRIFFGEW